MKILYQFATAKQLGPQGRAEIDRRIALLNAWAPPDVTVEAGTVAGGPLSIESEYDAAFSVPHLLTSIAAAEEQGFDAAVISCFSDPGLEAARERVRIPVLASGLCAMHMAAMLGHRFSIVSPRDGVGRPREQARRFGLEHLFCSSRGIGLSVLDLAADRPAAIARMAEAARLAVQDGADTVIFGCMSMAFHDVAPAIQAEVGVPVINPAPISVDMAAMLVRAGLSQSKRAYPTPPSLAQAAE